MARTYREVALKANIKLMVDGELMEKYLWFDPETEELAEACVHWRTGEVVLGPDGRVQESVRRISVLRVVPDDPTKGMVGVGASLGRELTVFECAVAEAFVEVLSDSEYGPIWGRITG